MQKFPDCHAFAQDVSLTFVQQVSEMGRTLSMREQGLGLLNFLSGATSGNLKVGWNLLQASGSSSFCSPWPAVKVDRVTSSTYSNLQQ